MLISINTHISDFILGGGGGCCFLMIQGCIESFCNAKAAVTALQNPHMREKRRNFTSKLFLLAYIIFSILSFTHTIGPQ